MMPARDPIPPPQRYIIRNLDTGLEMRVDDFERLTSMDEVRHDRMRHGLGCSKAAAPGGGRQTTRFWTAAPATPTHLIAPRRTSDPTAPPMLPS